ncbi:MAG TPA: succinate dehydrogenase, cytochrome b556 subunit [Holosporales bacterium]|nr:succinate dehydrogenase, cytochrome b556 subunit [Holosporales bacterium]
MHEKPLSPHLQIYKPQLTSVLSIMHRISGVFLGVGVLHFLLFLWSLALIRNDQPGSGEPLLACLMLSFFTAWLIMPALVYHTLNGIRHLCWDCGFGLGIKAVYRSGWLVVLLTCFSFVVPIILFFLR